MMKEADNVPVEEYECEHEMFIERLQMMIERKE